MLEGERMFRIVLSPAGFSNFAIIFVRHCRIRGWASPYRLSQGRAYL